MPRIFFADEPEQQHKFVGRPYGQPPGLGQPAGLRPGLRGSARGRGRGSCRVRPAAQQPGGPPAARQRPQRARPTRPPERELRHRAIASLILSVLSLVALLGLGSDLHRGVYLLIFSAVVGIAGCVIGITAVRKARKTGSYRPRGAIGGIVLGAIAALLSIPILATYLAFPDPGHNYVKCLSQAQSSGAQQSCMDRFYRSIHLGSPGSAAGGHHGSTRRPLRAARTVRLALAGRAPS